MSFCLVLVLALGPLASALAQGDAVKAEMHKLQGTWVRVSVDVNGKKTEDGNRPAGEAVTLTIQGDKFGGETFTLDPTKSPKHIDVLSVDDKGRAITLPGIYELKDGELKVCFPFPFGGKFDKIGQRPTEFGSKRGGNDVLEVYKRRKE